MLRFMRNTFFSKNQPLVNQDVKRPQQHPNRTQQKAHLVGYYLRKLTQSPPHAIFDNLGLFNQLMEVLQFGPEQGYTAEVTALIDALPCANAVRENIHHPRGVLYNQLLRDLLPALLNHGAADSLRIVFTKVESLRFDACLLLLEKSINAQDSSETILALLNEMLTRFDWTKKAQIIITASQSALQSARYDIFKQVFACVQDMGDGLVKEQCLGNIRYQITAEIQKINFDKLDLIKAEAFGNNHQLQKLELEKKISELRHLKAHIDKPVGSWTQPSVSMR